MGDSGGSIFQGSLGSGKSAAAVALGLRHIARGGVVAANFSLRDGWAESLASMHVVSRFSADFSYKRAVSNHARFFKVQSVSAIMSIDVQALAVGKEKTIPGKYQEGQGLLILDEAQLIFNTRSSMSGDKNLSWIEFFTQSRKLGWRVILIAHKAEMIDSQIRDLFEYETRMRNLQKMHIPILGLPLCPFPCFLLITRYAGLGPGASMIHSRDLAPLPKWAAKLYDSKLVFSRDTGQGPPVAELCGPPPTPPLCGGAGGSYPLLRRSALAGSFWDGKIKGYHRPFGFIGPVRCRGKCFVNASFADL